MMPDDFTARYNGNQITELQCFYRIHPEADPWYQTGMICSTLANVMGDGKKKWTPEDFIPRIRRRKTGSEIKEMFKRWGRQE